VIEDRESLKKISPPLFIMEEFFWNSHTHPSSILTPSNPPDTETETETETEFETRVQQGIVNAVSSQSKRRQGPEQEEDALIQPTAVVVEAIEDGSGGGGEGGSGGGGDEDDDDTGASAIRYVNDALTAARKREGHLMVLLPLSRLEEEEKERRRQLIEFRVYVELSAFLAFKHIQQSSGSVLPPLTRRLETCDFQWTYEHHDTGFSPIQAASALMNNGFGTVVAQSATNKTATGNTALSGSPVTQQQVPPTTNQIENNDDALPEIVTIIENDDAFLEVIGDNDDAAIRDVTSVNMTARNSSSTTTRDQNQQFTPKIAHDRLDGTNLQQKTQKQRKQPFAIMGAARSLVSQTIGYLGEALDLPQISSSSTASTLNDLSLFARTVPTNSGDAHTIVAYLNSLGVKNVGVLYIKDSWGEAYEHDIQVFAQHYGITVYSVAYDEAGGMESVMFQLKQSRIRYFVGIINPGSWKKVVRAAYQNGLMGTSDHQWYLGDLVELVGDNFALDRSTEADIADALHGTGVILLKVIPHEAFDQAVAAFADNRTLQQEFIQSHAEPYLFDNFTFSSDPGRSLFQYLTYDAVIALGLTACDTPGLFTGQEFYNQLVQIDFQGVSGRVQLDEKTGTRLAEGMDYEIVNLVLLNQPASSSKFIFDARTSITVELSSDLADDDLVVSLPAIQVNTPFLYHNNATDPPIPLPELQEDMNLIPDGLRYFGLSLSFMIMVFSIGCAVFTYLYRKEFVVRASQPIFLLQICLGTFILATTIIPLSFQEDMPGLDIACAFLPWCLCIGFTVAIAALFTKAKRINTVMRSGTSFRRVEVKAADVMRPSLFLLGINIALLIGWTASPYRLGWHRERLANYDEFGRSVESYGMCQAAEGGLMFLIFFIPLTIANLAVMAIATYESYKGRNLPLDFSEAKYLAVSMIFICETIVLGGTTMAAVWNIPPAFFLVASLVLSIGCLSILLPVFVPKYLQRSKREQTTRVAISGLSVCSRSQQISGNNLVGNQNSDEDQNSSRLSLFSRSSTLLASQPQAIRRITNDKAQNEQRASVFSQINTHSSRLGNRHSSIQQGELSSLSLHINSLPGSARSSVRTRMDTIGVSGSKATGCCQKNEEHVCEASSSLHTRGTGRESSTAKLSSVHEVTSNVKKCCDQEFGAATEVGHVAAMDDVSSSANSIDNDTVPMNMPTVLEDERSCVSSSGAIAKDDNTKDSAKDTNASMEDEEVAVVLPSPATAGVGEYHFRQQNDLFKAAQDRICSRGRQTRASKNE